MIFKPLYEIHIFEYMKLTLAETIRIPAVLKFIHSNFSIYYEYTFLNACFKI